MTAKQWKAFQIGMTVAGTVLSLVLGEARWTLHRVLDQLDDVRLRVARIEGRQGPTILYPSPSP